MRETAMQAKTLGGAGLGFCRHKLTDSIRMLATATCIGVTVVLCACGGGSESTPQAKDAVTQAIGAATHTLTFDQVKTQFYATQPDALIARSSSGLPVSFTSSTPTVCIIDANALKLLNAGTCTVTAAQAGNSVYAPASPVSRSFTVGRSAQKITFPNLVNQFIEL